MKGDETAHAAPLFQWGGCASVVLLEWMRRGYQGKMA